ncbi:23S ribosomal RNA methyltransferase Erm [archaeon]|nr:23S ribosomal RNA methyltransferase Erm [archaeon]
MRKIGHSQNFIRNPKVIDFLVRKSKITKNDLVVELGAGDGEITKILSKYSKEVIAIEKDKKLYKKLFNDLNNKSNVKILNTDIFDYHFPEKGSYKVFSNIPFNYTADIVRLLTAQQNLSDDIYLFAQKQSAQNYCGQPKTKESLKSLFLKLHFKTSIVYQFKKGDFRPTPRVDIVLLRLQKLPQPLLKKAKITNFKDFVVYAFSQTKPSIKQGLSSIFTVKQFDQISKDFKIKSKNKPRDLSLEQWLDLYNFFNTTVDQKKKNFVNNSYQKLLGQQKSLKKIHRTRVDKKWKEK